jgi:hypothetical protein
MSKLKPMEKIGSGEKWSRNALNDDVASGDDECLGSRPEKKQPTKLLLSAKGVMDTNPIYFLP